MKMESSANTPHPDTNTVVENEWPRDVRLQCPQCGVGIEAGNSCACGSLLRVCNGILDALLPARRAHYARFMEDYERIRMVEGRGSISEDFYLALPYKDISGRNEHQWRIRSQSFDCLMRRVLKPNLPEAGARILDLGAGNGWMSYRLAAAGYHPVAVDLLVNDFDGLGAIKHYHSRLRGLFPRIRAELVHLPLRQNQFDAAVFNASFHYAEDYTACLREAFRCVREGGLVIISDTPWYSSEQSGQQMLAERRSSFLAQFGFASDSIASLEYLTHERLCTLEEQLSIRWTVYTPNFDLRWRMRPLIARLRHRRDPSRFRIYAARKPAA
ncbi:class I SAM-dependent methyltransferase [Acidicapsa dinghuensis]|uniref:Class I SAM-dependent methyltransferase n=1 Tax=Acidicapsa dinghuensis TaxID=2218256 RepID=A0ABW1EGK3_9BACT|nr:class I SAM-dependent methyltransferase [Acidicapsa dinghuensis]